MNLSFVLRFVLHSRRQGIVCLCSFNAFRVMLIWFKPIDLLHFEAIPQFQSQRSGASVRVSRTLPYIIVQSEIRSRQGTAHASRLHFWCRLVAFFGPWLRFGLRLSFGLAASGFGLACGLRLSLAASLRPCRLRFAWLGFALAGLPCLASLGLWASLGGLRLPWAGGPWRAWNRAEKSLGGLKIRPLGLSCFGPFLALLRLAFPWAFPCLVRPFLALDKVGYKAGRIRPEKGRFLAFRYTYDIKRAGGLRALP